MQLTLSWDLLVVIFFATIVAYSFIVGRDSSVKIIIATYISIVAVQGTGNVLMQLSDSTKGVGDIIGLPGGGQWVALIKIGLFVAVILFLALRGGFDMHYVKDIPGIWDTLLTGVFGFATAGLILSTLLTYIAGKPILAMDLGTSAPLTPLLAQSTLIDVMVRFQNVWFAFPAILLLAMGFFSTGEDDA